MAWNGFNRRQFPRLVYPCLVTIKSKEMDNVALLTHTENIGVGGIGVIVRAELKLFSHVDVEVDLLDESDHILAQGSVAWVVRRKATEKHKPFFYDPRIQFENIQEKDKGRLETAVVQCIQNGFKISKPVY